MKKRECIPRGIRNNNPLNIRRSKTKWQGEIERSEVPSSSGRQGSSEGALNVLPAPQRGANPHSRRGKAEGEFVVFAAMEWGLRAGFCLLHTYAVKYRRNSVNSIIARWAPASENNTAAYIRNVCQWTGFGGNQRLTEADWPTLLKAMCRMECGYQPTDEVLQKAWELYRPSPQPLPQMGGAATAKTK